MMLTMTFLAEKGDLEALNSDYHHGLRCYFQGRNGLDTRSSLGRHNLFCCVFAEPESEKGRQQKLEPQKTRKVREIERPN